MMRVMIGTAIKNQGQNSLYQGLFIEIFLVFTSLARSLTTYLLLLHQLITINIVLGTQLQGAQNVFATALSVLLSISLYFLIKKAP